MNILAEPATINFITIFLVTLCATGFFIYIYKNTQKNSKQSVGYIILFFLIMVLAYFTTTLRIFGYELFSIASNNMLYIIGAFAIVHAVGYRSKRFTKKIYLNLWVYACLFTIVLCNVFLFYLWHNNISIRIIILNVLMTAILFSAIPYATKHQKKPIAADKLMRFSLIILPLVNLLLCSLLIGFSYIEFFYLYSLPIHIVIMFCWAMSFLSVLMLDNNEQHYRNSITDSLTGLFNRRYFFKKVTHILSTDKTKHCVAIIDIDNFKQVNDNYGHSTGDLIIKQVADVIKTHNNVNDISCRYGGEEYAIFFENTSHNNALKRLEAIRAYIAENSTFKQYQVTVSIGLASVNQSTCKSCIDNADKALYSAKQSGKNRIVSAE